MFLHIPVRLKYPFQTCGRKSNEIWCERCFEETSSYQNGIVLLRCMKPGLNNHFNRLPRHFKEKLFYSILSHFALCRVVTVPSLSMASPLLSSEIRSQLRNPHISSTSPESIIHRFCYPFHCLLPTACLCSLPSLGSLDSMVHHYNSFVLYTFESLAFLVLYHSHLTEPNFD